MNEIKDDDVIAAARNWIAENGGRLQTHSATCHNWHLPCLMERLVGIVERHGEAIRRLSEQDATLSLQGGNVIIEMDATPSEGSVPARDTVADEPPPDPERFNEWLRKPYWVDPPSGWRYGFPKLYDPAKDGNMTEWMVANGYPQHLADQNLPCTFTAATE